MAAVLPPCARSSSWLREATRAAASLPSKQQHSTTRARVLNRTTAVSRVTTLACSVGGPCSLTAELKVARRPAARSHSPNPHLATPLASSLPSVADYRWTRQLQSLLARARARSTKSRLSSGTGASRPPSWPASEGSSTRGLSLWSRTICGPRRCVPVDVALRSFQSCLC